MSDEKLEDKQKDCDSGPQTNLQFGLEKLADISLNLAKNRYGAVLLSFGILFLLVSIAFSVTTWVIANNADNIIKIVDSVKK
jgi:hypothetical protein